MINILRYLILTLFWLQAFAAPVIFLGLLALWVYSYGGQYKTIALILLIAGIILGIVTAEFIRRRYGLSVFFSRIYGPNAMDTKKKNDSSAEDPV